MRVRCPRCRTVIEAVDGKPCPSCGAKIRIGKRSGPPLPRRAAPRRKFIVVGVAAIAVLVIAVFAIKKLKGPNPGAPKADATAKGSDPPPIAATPAGAGPSNPAVTTISLHEVGVVPIPKTDARPKLWVRFDFAGCNLRMWYRDFSAEQAELERPKVMTTGISKPMLRRDRPIRYFERGIVATYGADGAIMKIVEEAPAVEAKFTLNGRRFALRPMLDRENGGLAAAPTWITFDDELRAAFAKLQSQYKYTCTAANYQIEPDEGADRGTMGQPIGYVQSFSRAGNFLVLNEFYDGEYPTAAPYPPLSYHTLLDGSSVVEKGTGHMILAEGGGKVFFVTPKYFNEIRKWGYSVSTKPGGDPISEFPGWDGLVPLPGRAEAVARMEGHLAIVNLETGNITAKLPAPADGWTIVSPDGKTIAVSHSKGVALIDGASAKTLVEFPGESGLMAFCPDGGHFACGSSDTLMLWDAARKKLEHLHPGFFALEGSFLAARDGNSDSFFQLDRNSQVREWRIDVGQCHIIPANRSTGGVIATATGVAVEQLWSGRGEPEDFRLLRLPGFEPMASLKGSKSLNSAERYVSASAIAFRDGVGWRAPLRIYPATGGEGRSIKFPSAKGFELIKEWRGNVALAMSITKTGATTGIEQDQFFDTAGPEAREIRTLGIAWGLSPSGRYVISATSEGMNPTVYRVNDGGQVARLPAAPARIPIPIPVANEPKRPEPVIDYSPSERFVAMLRTMENDLVVLDLQTGSVVGTITPPPGKVVLFLGERRLLLLAEESATVLEITGLP